MTRIAVQGEVYVSAAEAFVRANQLAASSHDRLGAVLVRSAAMAGDDATATEFGEGYDVAATEVLGADAELVDALATLARLVDRSSENHRAAESSSAVDRSPAVAPSPVPDLVAVSTTRLPSCIGGDDPDLPELWNLVVDHLQGFAWPNADVDRLRSAGTAWRNAASMLRMIPDLCRTGSSALESQHSAEVRVALDAVADLSRGVEELARMHDDVGRACLDHADDVEEHREIVKGILHDLAVEVGVTLGVGIALSFFTFGGGAVIGTAIAATRSVAAAHRILATLHALQAAARLGAVPRVASVSDDIRPLRSVLARFAQADRLGDAAAVRQAVDLDSWRNLPRQVEYTWDSAVTYKKGGRMMPMEHVRQGHWPDSTLPGKGHFSEGVTEEMVMDYVDEAVRAGQVHTTQAGRIDLDLGRVIGTDINGAPTRGIRVHIHHGVVTSAYPVRPL